MILQPALASAAVGTTSSLNWAGYTASSAGAGAYTGVHASWVVPNVTSATALEADATWIGIGGITGNDLIQTGTQAIVQDGQVTYQAWTETLPAISQNISTITVHPGDTVSASIASEGGSLWNITFDDDSTGQSYTTNVTYASSASSAEWIEEMPESGNTLLQLDQYGSVTFNDAGATVNGIAEGISQTNAQPMTMINGSGQTLSSVSAISAAQGFTVTRSTASSTTSPFSSRGSGIPGRTPHRLGSGQGGYTTRGRSTAAPAAASSQQFNPFAWFQQFSGGGYQGYTVTIPNYGTITYYFR